VLSTRLSGLGGIAITGLGYPVVAGASRLLLQSKLKAGASLTRIDRHGMLLLIVAIVFNTPQFFVLTRYGSGSGSGGEPRTCPEE
jgi:hypothetical protein